MPLNPYFLQGAASEQRLVQDIINEQLKMFGQDVIYLPRKIVNKTNILKEVTSSKFDDAFRIEAYLMNYEGFEGSGDILTKFGVQTTDSVTFVISKERYEDFITPFLDDEVELTSRPQEGDLIYFPLDNTIFEIKYVEAKKPFYQLQKLYAYTLSCEVFDMALDDQIETSIESVDKAAVEFGYTVQLAMVGLGASTATATVERATVGSGLTVGNSVQFIDLINDGTGYTAAPTIGISTAPVLGVNATAVAIMTSRTGQTSSGLSIDRILLTNPGFGYTQTPTLTITPTNSYGVGAAATIVISESGLGAFNITNAGAEYGVVPNVTVEPATTGGIATAHVGTAGTDRSSVGILTGLTLTGGGLGYKSTPSVTIAAPPVRIGVVTNFSPSQQGSGFQVNDEVLIRYRDGYYQGIGTDAYLKVTAISGTGAITGSEIKYGGHSYDKDKYYQVDPPNGGTPAIDYFYNANFLGLSTNTQDTGTTATATCSITAGLVTSITLTNPGVGYTSPPTVTIANDSSVKDAIAGVADAKAEAVLGADGTIIAIRWSNSGAGYNSAPSVTIDPPATSVSGDYMFKEVVRGVGSGTTALVQSWDADTRILLVNNVSGDFIAGERVVGIGTTLNGSDATYIVKSVSDQDDTDLYGDNSPFETEADSILDFSESNPFGEF